MKRSITILVSAVILTSAALAATAITITGINGKLAEVMKTYNNNSTLASLKLTHLTYSSDQINTIGVHADFKKTGKKNYLNFSGDVNYQFAATGGPTINYSLTADSNYIVAFSQKKFNEIAPDLNKEIEDEVKGLSSGYGYGNATTVSVKNDQINRDKAGNVMSGSMEAMAQVDLSKVPANMISSLPIVAIQTSLNYSTVSFGLKGQIVMNSQYNDFKQGQTGLLHDLDLLNSGDKQTYAEINSVMADIDQALQHYVDGVNIF